MGTSQILFRSSEIVTMKKLKCTEVSWSQGPSTNHEKETCRFRADANSISLLLTGRKSRTSQKCPLLLRWPAGTRRAFKPRVLASTSQEENLLSSFFTGTDVKITASCWPYETHNRPHGIVHQDYLAAFICSKKYHFPVLTYIFAVQKTLGKNNNKKWAAYNHPKPLSGGVEATCPPHVNLCVNSTRSL